jgi:predicted TPR repeat methyltransferase
MKAGEWRDAAESFKKVVELDPEDETTRNKLERASKKIEKLPT